MPKKISPEMKARAVRMVLEHRDDYPSEWAAITAVPKRLGMNAETLRMSLEQGRTVFWSRSRQEVWRKGDTSGDR